MANDDWTDFGTSAKAQGTDRSKIISAFIAWYLDRPGAVLPERPGGTEPDGQTVRIEQSIWNALAPQAKTPAQRQQLINQILDWYLRRPSA